MIPEQLYRHLPRLLGAQHRALLSRLAYRLALLPEVARGSGASAAYPLAREACLVVSADFELAWGWRHAKGIGPERQAYAVRCANQGRQNIPRLLALFDRYDIPVTWAVVGHLLLDQCRRENGRAHSELERPPYFENECARYASGDWLEADPCTDFLSDPAWYAPDLVRRIMQARARHELGCHTFSHIDCSDAHCPPSVMDCELDQCQRLAAEWGLGLNSLVFPFNLVGNLASVKRHGFAAYRGPSCRQLDVPRQDAAGLWRVPGGVCIERPVGWPADAWIDALRHWVARALDTGTVLHLWFHPCCHPLNVETIWPALLGYIDKVRDDLWITTMGGLAAWLSGESAAGGVSSDHAGMGCPGGPSRSPLDAL